MSKRYLKRGLSTGIIIYVLFIIVTIITSALYQSSHSDASLAYIGVIVVVVLFWPVIPLGALIGWMYGKSKTNL